jgi:membrane protease YdiL (CAAX protease family)
MSAISSRNQPISSVVTPSWVQRHPLIAYFAIAFAGTWALTVPLALSSGFNLFPMPDIAFILLFIFSIYLGPFLGALIVTRATEGSTGIRQLLKRAVQWRVGVRWYLAAIFSFLLIWLAAFSVLFRGAPLRGFIANPLLLVTLFLPWLLQGILIPSLGEELGWRGFAFPRLQAQYGPIRGTLILGALQGLWHLPILFTPLLGPFTLEKLTTFVLTAIGGVFLYNWVFNNARGSVWIAILMHASSNAASRLLEEIIPQELNLPAPIQALSLDWINVIIFGLVAILLAILTRGRLGYQTEARSE